MDVPFAPELEKKLNEFAEQTGRPAPDLVQDAVADMMDELAATREMLDRRYDEIKSGKVKMIPGDEAFARLMAKTKSQRH
jgi:predicted transcriptional regulator